MVDLRVQEDLEVEDLRTLEALGVEDSGPLEDLEVEDSETLEDLEVLALGMKLVGEGQEGTVLGHSHQCCLCLVMTWPNMVAPSSRMRLYP